jgi:hypothetical protein
VSYVRFTPEEFQDIQEACRPVHLSPDYLGVFKYFLIESLQERSPQLAQRIRRFRRQQVEILFSYMQKLEAMAAQGGSPAVAPDGDEHLTFEEVQAVRKASTMFLPSTAFQQVFRAFLIRCFQDTAPELAQKLARLSEAQVRRLYQQVERHKRWVG